MTKNDKLLCWVYGLISVAALFATWTNNLAFFMQPENREITSFIRALYVNHAAASIANDIIFYCLAGFIFIVHEGKRLAMRYVWVYILLSMMVAVAVIFPLFLIARQVALSKQRVSAGLNAAN